MHFDFSSETHKWCAQCGGNIRNAATWCRFCHRNIGSRFLRDNNPIDPSIVIDAVSMCFSDFQQIVLRCSPALAARFQSAHEATQDKDPGIGGSYSDRKIAQQEKGFCLFLPPEKRLLGLVYDICLNLTENDANLEEILNDSRLKLIDITKEKIESEFRRRLEEIATGKTCDFCKEFVSNVESECRYCGAVGETPPVSTQSFDNLLQPIDLKLLHSILVWEAARREKDNPLSLSFLLRNEISENQIAEQIKSQAINSKAFPKSDWRKAMEELNLQCEISSEDAQFMDLQSCASACSWAQKYEEAIVVYEHGLNRISLMPQFLAKKPYMLEGLAQVYFHTKEYEKHYQLNEEANALKLELMPEPLRTITQESAKETESMISKMFGDRKEDSKKIIEDSEQRLKKILDRSARLIEHSDNPELAKLMQFNKALINKALNVGMEIAKLRVAANEAKTAGDIDKANSCLNDALALCTDKLDDVNSLIGLKSNLASNCAEQGKLDEAERLHLEAIALGQEVAALNEGREHLPLMSAYFQYAKTLFDSGRFSESEIHLHSAIHFGRLLNRKHASLTAGKNADMSPTEAGYKELLVQIFRATNRDAEADQLETEIANIRSYCEEQEEKRKAERRRYEELNPRKKNQ